MDNCVIVPPETFMNIVLGVDPSLKDKNLVIVLVQIIWNDWYFFDHNLELNYSVRGLSHLS